MSFKTLGLIPELLKAVDKQGYTSPSPIQEKTIPAILEGKDVLASAQTGTGKTAGFTLPLLQNIIRQKKSKKRFVRALILTPTRELAAQVYDNVKNYSQFANIRSTVIFGGVSDKPQIKQLRNGVDIIVATPGRLLDLISQQELSLKSIETFVLDEADQMLDMGFLNDIKKVIALMPDRRQNLLFSATFSKSIKKLANDLLNRPIAINAAPENTTADRVSQITYKVNQSDKVNLTIKLISEGNWNQVLIFTRTKHRANRLSEKLIKAGISSAAIHGNKSQGARTKALSGFKSNSIRVLVATDIAARGIDIPLLPYVINFELPNVPEDYVHRIGRTGRAGASGQAISLVDISEREYVTGIEKLLKQKLQSEIVEGFEPTNTVTSPKNNSNQRKKNFSKKKRHNNNWKKSKK